MKIIDEHVHIAKQFDINEFCEFVLAKSNKANIIACGHSECLSLLLPALKCKQLYPDKFYCFSEPDPSVFYLHQNDLGEYLCADLQKQLDMGADGIKLLEGKPQVRKKYPIPDFDLSVWEPFWKYMEEKQIPILMHLNDPENFWNINEVPSFAKTQGWFYDESYVNNEDQYQQMLNVLNKHKNLKISFAHFMFLSKQLDRLAIILDSFPNVYIDLTPGIEMYENFSLDIGKTKAFFNKYIDRIMYGSDIGGRCVLMGEDKAFDIIENNLRPKLVLNFLTSKNDLLIESDDHYLINRKPFTMHCLNLDNESLDKITYQNFERFVSVNPKPLNLSLIDEYKDDLRNKIKTMADQYNFKQDYSIFDIKF